MLIICNGAFKSGSSWLHAILVELAIIKKLDLQKVPPKYTNDVNSPTTIIESQLNNFLVIEDFNSKNYLTKAHFFKKKTLRREYPEDVKFLFIKRDIKDAIVSHYFHFNNKYRNKISFSMYYFFLGRYKAYEISLFNYRCKKFMGDKNFFYYSDLIYNFEETLREIARCLEIDDLSDKELVTIKEQTTLVKLREKLKKGRISYYPSNKGSSFREGKVGGWRKYFTSSQLKDVTRIENEKFSILSKIVYLCIFSLRRIIFKIE